MSATAVTTFEQSHFPLAGLARYDLHSLPEFSKFQDLFFEKCQERSNHTGGIVLCAALRASPPSLVRALHAGIR